MVTLHDLLGLVRKISNKLTSLIKRGTTNQLLDPSDSGQFQIYQVSYLGSSSNCESVLPYGICGVAPKDSTPLMMNVMGNEANKAGIFSFPQKRFKGLKPGEFQVGNFVTLSSSKYTENGDIVTISTKGYNLTIKENLTVQIDGTATVNANTSIEVTAPIITINGDLQVNGDINATGTITAPNQVADISLLAGGKQLVEHDHGGVMAGGDDTGPNN